MYYGGLHMFYDPTYVLVVIGTILCIMASANVKGTFQRYSNIRNARGLTGYEVASRILMLSGITDVRIERVAGDMTDHYDSRNKVLRLSDTVYDRTSVAAVGVAAHECGHAIQHAHHYVPLHLRHLLVPVANIGTNLAWPVLIFGSIFGATDTLVPLGILMFAAGVLFHIVTLPVEFNASTRAVSILRKNNILSEEELRPTKKVLTAAALTYVAGAVAMLLNLLRVLILFGGRDND